MGRLTVKKGLIIAVVAVVLVVVVVIVASGSKEPQSDAEAAALNEELSDEAKADIAASEARIREMMAQQDREHARE